jgi:N-methylhydantoinase B
MTLDPVTLAVIQNGLRQVASEMDLVHEKTSFSPVISEGFDRSNGIYDRTTGEVVAQGELGLPIFVGVMQFTTQAVIARRRDLEPGDVILVNDPYLGGTHLMDVKMVRPFYYRGRLWCYLSNTGHWPDTGGMVPGGFSATATEIVQEGLRLPPVKLVRRGEICQDIIDMRRIGNPPRSSFRPSDVLEVGPTAAVTWLRSRAPGERSARWRGSEVSACTI